jgi:DNA replication and repair protein RecF
VRLAWLELRDFRNHRETRLEVPEGLVAAVGPNAQGKTNLLEAAHYLMTLGSPRASSDEPLVRRGARQAYLRGEAVTAAGRVLVEVEIRASGANRVEVNRSGTRRKRDLRERVRSVMFTPDDVAIVQGDPDVRRRFMDEASHTLWPGEEAPRRAFERALRQRNRLLKEHEGPGDPPGLDAWDAELARSGAQVTAARGRAMAMVGPRADDAFRQVAEVPLLVAYRASVQGEDMERAFLEALEARRGDELVRRTTLVGPHRDELDLGVRELAARRFASHGETWAAALCLRLGLAGAVQAETGEWPVLVLDDPFSGLDPTRRRRLGERLRALGQVLVSAPDETVVPAGAAVWEVDDGQVRARPA